MVATRLLLVDLTACPLHPSFHTPCVKVVSSAGSLEGFGHWNGLGLLVVSQAATWPGALLLLAAASKSIRCWTAPEVSPSLDSIKFLFRSDRVEMYNPNIRHKPLTPGLALRIQYWTMWKAQFLPLFPVISPACPMQLHSTLLPSDHRIPTLVLAPIPKSHPCVEILCCPAATPHSSLYRHLQRPNSGLEGLFPSAIPLGSQLSSNAGSLEGFGHMPLSK